MKTQSCLIGGTGALGHTWLSIQQGAWFCEWVTAEWGDLEGVGEGSIVAEAILCFPL
jgi:hypothetical protein